MEMENDEEDEKITFLLSEIHIKPAENSDIIPSSDSAAIASETAADLEKELAKFRNEWKDEVSNKSNPNNVITNRQGKNIAVYHEFPKRQRPVAEHISTEEELYDLDDEFHYEQPENNEDKAKYLFNKGILLEQQNRHYEAIKFYRMALQLDSNIEYKVYAPVVPAENTSKKVETSITNYNSVKVEIEDDDSEKSLYERFLADNAENSFCSKNFPQQVKHISELPTEVLMNILKWVVSDQLDIRSLEIFASVCKGFFVCARDPEIWRLACARVWGQRGLSLQKYENWRDMYLRRPRLNFDGVYISKTSYVRAGEQSLDNFYAPWHLVEYYRYFRFFADGSVLFMTCADEPKNVVNKLNVAITGQSDILKGEWTLDDSKISILVNNKILINKTIKYTRRPANSKKDLIDKDQIFRIELDISSEKKKLNNQLKWIKYEIEIFYRTTNKKSITVLELNKIDFPIFYFSRVKSYLKDAYLPLS